MEDTDCPCHSMSSMGTQNRCSFEYLEVAHANLLWNGRVIPHIGRYGGLNWYNLGLWILDAQAVFPLSTSEG